MDTKYLLLIFATITLANSLKTYEGFKVYKVTPKNIDEVKALQEIKKSTKVEFWDDLIVVDYNARIIVGPEQEDMFLEHMKAAKIEASEVTGDLQRVIEDQLKPAVTARSSETFHGYTWDRYHTLDEINTWLDELAANYPNIVSPVSMGRSVENRDIKGIIINYRNSTLIGMLEGTLHAREWISPATVTWIVKEFLTSTDPQVRAMAETFQWHVFPVVNPDGYVYTFTTHRMWRKNRSPESIRSCVDTGVDDDMSHGVDLNRNFGFEWMSVGASDNPCTNTYAGPVEFSEPETRAIAQYVLNLRTRGDFIYYISFHSFTQLIIMPYSNVGGQELLINNNYGDLYEIGIRSADAIARRYGTVYRVGASADVLYPMSGSSFDWVKQAAGVPISYLVELRDLGDYGFLLPPEQIIPNNLEFMDGFIEMDRTTRMLGYYSAAANNFVSGVVVSLSALFVMLLQ